MSDRAIPVRIQRKRAKGWRMPPNTKCVTRPGRWGNPFETAAEFADAIDDCIVLRAVPEFMDREKGERILWMIKNIGKLQGSNLACFCSLDKSCHADTLLDLANRKPMAGVYVTTEDVIKRLRKSSGNGWDRVPDVRAEIAELRGTDEAVDDNHPSVMELVGLFEGSPEKFGEGFESWE